MGDGGGGIVRGATIGGVGCTFGFGELKRHMGTLLHRF